MKRLIFLQVLFLFQISLCLGQTAMRFPAGYDEETWQSFSSSKLWHKLYWDNSDAIYRSVVSINNGDCSGVIISKQGLLLTNYHCILNELQALENAHKISAKDGFMAKHLKQELVLNGIEIEVLDSVRNITNYISKGVPIGSTYKKLKTTQEKNIELFLNQLPKTKNQRFVIKAFEPNNEYYLLRYLIYSKVTLVAAPPVSAANFGGDAQNWQWPRYATDFCILRIYEDNEFESPIKSEGLEISLNLDLNQKVYSLGYPASTSRSGSALEIKFKTEFDNEIRTKLRRKRLHIMEEEMEYRPELSSKYGPLSQELMNYQLFAKGQTSIMKKYASILKNDHTSAIYNALHQAYDSLEKYSLYRLYLNEGAVAPQIFLFTFKFNALYENLKEGSNTETIEKIKKDLIDYSSDHFSNYDVKLDEQIFFKMIESYSKAIPSNNQPDIFDHINDEFDGDIYGYTKELFAKSLFSSKEGIMQFLQNPNLETLDNDPSFRHTSSFIEHYFTEIAPHINYWNLKIDSLNVAYKHDLKINNYEANSTLRLSEGSISGYSPEPGVYYDAFTKVVDWPSRIRHFIDENDYPKNLIDVWQTKSAMPLCFLASLDVTAGNSGSPVLNETGQLVGLVFDQNPEGMANQFIYDPEIQRAQCLAINPIMSMITDYWNARKLAREITSQRSNRAKRNR